MRRLRWHVMTTVLAASGLIRPRAVLWLHCSTLVDSGDFGRQIRHRQIIANPCLLAGPALERTIYAQIFICLLLKAYPQAYEAIIPKGGRPTGKPETAATTVLGDSGPGVDA
jgi:hypothetical protein